MDSGNDRMQNGAHRIGRGIEINDEVEEIFLDQFVGISKQAQRW